MTGATTSGERRPRGRARRGCAVSLVALGAWLVTVGSPPAKAQEATPEAPAVSPWLRYGPPRPEALLQRQDDADRLRGIERLGADGTPHALAQLAAILALEAPPGGGRGRLAAVRALAAHAPAPIAHRALVRAMTTTGSGDPGDELGPWVRASAALALAHAGTPAAWRALRLAVDAGGPLGEVAAAAIVAHPPRDVRDLLGHAPITSPLLVETLGQLGDQRAFLPLRAAVAQRSVKLGAQAAVALTRLGAFETVPLARHWLASDRSPERRLAAVQILILAGTADAPAAVAELAGDATTRETYLELVSHAPHPAAAAGLGEVLAKAPEGDQPRLLSALARAGGPAAVATLTAALDDPRSAGHAAYALALCADAAATRALSRALERAPVRRLAARAAVVRTAALGARIPGLAGHLESMLVSADPADRAAGAWGLAVHDSRRGAELLGDDDPGIVAAAARAALTSDLATRAAARLAVEPSPPLRTSLAIALANRTAAGAVSTALLLELLNEGGAPAPLAARELMARAQPRDHHRVEELLTSSVVDIRAHAAMGLGESGLPGAVGRLERGYRYEPNATVRRALVIALGRSGAGAHSKTLTLAALLDMDPGVRASARAALADQPASLAATGSGSVWVTVLEPDGSAAPETALAVELPNGLLLPVRPDPDGLVVLAGVATGSVRLRLAAAPRTEHPAPRHGRQGPQRAPPRPLR